jgi:hypothetical protein
LEDVENAGNQQTINIARRLRDADDLPDGVRAARKQS